MCYNSSNIMIKSKTGSLPVFRFVWNGFPDPGKPFDEEVRKGEFPPPAEGKTMKLKKFGNTEQRIYELAAPIVTGLGYIVWDIRFEKEGASWYLRVFIDHEERTIGITDCEKVTTPISDMLDEEDPISQSYILEISSAGLERDLCRESHFDACLDSEVRVRGIRPFEDGSRELIGVLTAWDKDTVTVRTETAEHTLPFAALAFVKLYYDFD